MENNVIAFGEKSMSNYVFRACGIALGALALIKLAEIFGLVQYNVTFSEWISVIERWSTDIPLNEVKVYLVSPLMSWLRLAGLDIPPLLDHWKQVLVLNWLYVASWARNPSPGQPPTWLQLIVAFFCLLPFSVAAGTFVVSSIELMTLSAAGFTAFLALTSLIEKKIFQVWFFSSFTIIFSISGYFSEINDVNSNMIVQLAFAIFGFTLITLFNSMAYAPGGFWQRLQHPNSAMSLDILTTMCVAFVISLFAASPSTF